ncbi:hypothetical protein [Rhodococcus sp. ZPP]|uniref:hypothetical protein n=1 Tax=Rhodococcus sp. ZPP TaxID=2749906 RepID=UPI001FCCC63A|nr:hypothetical protein [Rhodococcus sp. ZPP]
MSKVKAEGLGLSWIAEIGRHGVVAGPNSTLQTQPARTIAQACEREGIDPKDLELAHLAAYEQICETIQGGAYLRGEGLHSSLISEWREQRDAGLLDGKPADSELRKLTTEQADIARPAPLTRPHQQASHDRRGRPQIMGKAHARTIRGIGTTGRNPLTYPPLSDQQTCRRPTLDLRRIRPPRNTRWTQSHCKFRRRGGATTGDNKTILPTAPLTM